MSPAAAAAPRTRTRKHAAPPRRVSGPGRARTAPQTSGAPRLVLRLGGAVHGIAEHRWLERLIRGRAWIAIVGVGLIGIVFMQVSMLRMNAGIGRSVERASVLERENAALSASISELSSGDRIAAEASRLGLVLATSTPRFLDARDADAGRALRSMTAPGVGIVAITPSEPATPLPGSTTPTLGDTSVAPTTADTPMAADGTAATPTAGTTTTQPTTATTSTQPTTSTTQPTTSTAPPTTTSQPTQQPAAQPAATTQPQASSTPPTGGAEVGGQAG